MSTAVPDRNAGAVPWTLSAVLRREADAPELTREPVSAADLAEARGEAWLAGCLRRGRVDLALEDAPLRLVPLFKKDAGPRCLGFALEVELPGGPVCRREFSVAALDDVARRAARRLLAGNLLQPGDTYTYELVAEQRPLPLPPRDAAPFKVIGEKQPLRTLSLPLAPLLERARVVGDLAEDPYPVFYTEEALARAERFARKGADRDPPVETGAVLVGPLASCPQTGELFAVVCDALEVQDAEETRFSLAYTGKTWARLQAVMKARQARPATQAHRLLGQCHGHNFPPPGGPPCEVCPTVKVCTRTSVFVSADDWLWSRAVFAGQPWQLGHIFGLNARGEPVHALFGLHDGQLRERGFYVIPDFSP